MALKGQPQPVATPRLLVTEAPSLDVRAQGGGPRREGSWCVGQRSNLLKTDLRAESPGSWRALHWTGECSGRIAAAHLWGTPPDPGAEGRQCLQPDGPSTAQPHSPEPHGHFAQLTWIPANLAGGRGVKGGSDQPGAKMKKVSIF